MEKKQTLHWRYFSHILKRVDTAKNKEFEAIMATYNSLITPKDILNMESSKLLKFKYQNINI